MSFTINDTIAIGNLPSAIVAVSGVSSSGSLYWQQVGSELLPSEGGMDIGTYGTINAVKGFTTDDSVLASGYIVANSGITTNGPLIISGVNLEDLHTSTFNDKDTLFIKGDINTEGSIRFMIDPDNNTTEIAAQYLRDGGDSVLRTNKPQVLSTDNVIRDIVTQDTSIVDIYTESDFPTPSNGVCTLSSGKYVIKAPVTLTSITRFDCANSANIEIVSDNVDINVLTFIASDTMFNFSYNKNFRLSDITIVMTGANSKFMNIQSGQLEVKDSTIVFAGTNTTIGSFVNTTDTSSIIKMTDTRMLGFTTGLSIDTVGIVEFVSGMFKSNATGSDALITTLNHSPVTIIYAKLMLIGGINEFNFYVDPVIATDVSITQISTAGPQAMWKTGSKGEFVTINDSSLSHDVISSVTSSGGVARFYHSADTVYLNQTLILSGFSTNTVYNGTHMVTMVGTGYFELENVAFGSNETGAFKSDKVTVTDGGTTITEGESLYLTTHLSTDYDGGYKAFNVGPNNFDICAAYVGDHTGTWSSASLDYDNKHMHCKDFSGQWQETKTVASAFKSRNSGTTSITGPGTWDDLNLTDAVEGSTNSRFKLVNAVTGEMQYTGIKRMSGTLVVTINAHQLGGSNEYRMWVGKTAGIGTFDGVAVTGIIDVTTTQLVLHTSIELYPNDFFRVGIEAQSGSNDIVVTEYSLICD